MEVKTLEVRDRATFVPMMAIKPSPRNEAERYLWGRAGYGPEGGTEYVLLARLDGQELNYDPEQWSTGARTYATVHRWLIAHWDEVQNGDVVDVEFILGEKSEAKFSERLGTEICPRPGESEAL